MELCYYNDNPTELVFTLAIIGNALPHAQKVCAQIAKVFQKLATVIQPLALNVYAKEFLTLNDPDDQQVVAAWVLEQQKLPDNVLSKAINGDGISQTQASHLSSQIIDNWFTLVSMQMQQYSEATLPSYVRMASGRVRLFTPHTDHVWALLKFPRGSVTHEFLIEDDVDGEWVSAPIRERIAVPALSLEITNRGYALEMMVRIYWSWWFLPHTLEFAALQSCLQHITSDGWQHHPFLGVSDPDPYNLGGIPLDWQRG